MIRWTLVGLVLIDIPFLVALAILGTIYGYRDMATGYWDWREAHPWTYLASIPLIAGFVWWRKKS